MGELLFFHFRVTNVKLINEEKFFKHYSSNVRECLENDNTPSIFKNLLQQYVLGLPSMLKSRNDLDVVSNRWESIGSLFSGYIPLGVRDIQV